MNRISNLQNFTENFSLNDNFIRKNYPQHQDYNNNKNLDHNNGHLDYQNFITNLQFFHYKNIHLQNRLQLQQL